MVAAAMAVEAASRMSLPGEDGSGWLVWGANLLSYVGLMAWWAMAQLSVAPNELDLLSRSSEDPERSMLMLQAKSTHYKLLVKQLIKHSLIPVSAQDAKDIETSVAGGQGMHLFAVTGDV